MRYCRVRLSLSDPTSAYAQSSYPIHPVCIDGCLQSAVPSLWEGYRSSINTALVPAIIDDLVVHSHKMQSKSAIAVTTSQYVGIGRVDEAKNFKSHISVFDTNSGSSIIQIKGLHYHELDIHRDRHISHSFTRLHWKPDLSLLTEKQLSSLLPVTQLCSSKYSIAEFDFCDIKKPFHEFVAIGVFDLVILHLVISVNNIS